jgi:serine/threonine-protein kinase haspin
MENGTPTWTAVHEDVYDGTGEQWDVYRRMRDTVAGDWKGFHGITNVMVSVTSTREL